MSFKIFKIFMLCLAFGIISCKDKENNQNTEVDIIPAEEKKDELREGDGPMERSRVLARMRENDELSSFIEEFKKSGLEEEFEGKEGIYTIFAPSNAAYDRIPAQELEDETAETRESKANDMLYYIVEGDVTLESLRENIRASEDGKYEFRTALGEKLWATEEGGQVVLIDVLGNRAKIVTSELDEYYGAYHIIDNVLQPGGDSTAQ